MSERDFKEEMRSLRTAQQYVSAATLGGRFVGGILSLLPWWLSGAPWWALPVFAIVIGWLLGRLSAAYYYRKMARIVRIFHPELKL